MHQKHSKSGFHGPPRSWSGPRFQISPGTVLIRGSLFQATILEGKTRGSRLRAQNSDLEDPNSTNGKAALKEPIREGPIINDMAELLFMLDGGKGLEDNSEDETEDIAEEKPEVKTEDENDNLEEESTENDFKPQKCHECSTVLNSKEELLGHFSSVPLKSQRNAFGKFLWSLILSII